MYLFTYYTLLYRYSAWCFTYNIYGSWNDVPLISSLYCHLWCHECWHFYNYAAHLFSVEISQSWRHCNVPHITKWFKNLMCRFGTGIEVCSLLKCWLYQVCAKIIGSSEQLFKIFPMYNPEDNDPNTTNHQIMYCNYDDTRIMEIIWRLYGLYYTLIFYTTCTAKTLSNIWLCRIYSIHGI